MASGGVAVNIAPEKERLFAAGSQSATWEGGVFDPTTGRMTFTTDFSFNATLDATLDVFNVIKLYTSNNTAHVARLFFRYSDSLGNYRLRYSSGDGFNQNMKNSNVFDISEVGQATDPQSDNLRLTWTLTKGATADTWTQAVSLINTSSDTAIDLSYSAGTVWEDTITVSEEFHNDSSIMWGFNTTGINNAYIFSTSASVETIDSDGDGVGDNADAFENDPTESVDSDGDGFGDNADRFPNIPTQDIVNDIISNPSVYDLYSREGIQDLRTNSTILDVSNNQATIQIQMEESSNLESWNETGDAATMVVPADTDTKFFRFKMTE